MYIHVYGCIYIYIYNIYIKVYLAGKSAPSMMTFAFCIGKQRRYRQAILGAKSAITYQQEMPALPAHAKAKNVVKRVY